MQFVEAVRATIESALDGDAQAVFLLFSIYVLLVCTYSVGWQMRVNSWPSVIGRLEKPGLRRFGGTEWTKIDQQYTSNAS